MEKEINLKQQYLINEIINKGYNPKDFVDFLKNEKENGENINNWNYGELITLVNVFKNININKEEKEKNELYELDLTEYENYSKRIDIKKKRKNTILTTNEVNGIIINSIELNEGGIFSKSEIIYNFILSPINLLIVRSFSQLKWLFQSIQKEFPLKFIKSLPDNNNIEENTLFLHKNEIEAYINDLIKDKELKFSRALEIFLTSNHKEDYKLKEKELNNQFNKNILNLNNFSLKEYNKIKNNYQFFDLISDSKPYIDISINKHINNYIDFFNNKFKSNISLLESAKNIITVINKNFEEINYNLKNLTDIFNIINDKNSLKINEYIDYKIEIEKSIWENLSNSFINWGVNLNEEKNNLTKNFSIFFNEKQKEYTSMSNLINKRNLLLNDYKKYKNYIITTKEKILWKDLDKIEINEEYSNFSLDKEELFGNKDLLKKFILKEETNDFNNLTKIWGYYNKLIYNEIHEYNNSHLNDLISTIQEFVKNQNCVIKNNQIIWADLISHNKTLINK